MLEHTSIIEFYKEFVGVDNIHLIHGNGKKFRFACNESKLAVYDTEIHRGTCIFNDVFPKCVDRTISYTAESLLDLATDISMVYARSGGVFKDPMEWLSSFTNKAQDLCISLIPHENIFPSFDKKVLFMVGKNVIKDCNGVLMRGSISGSEA